jgi:hypothetical protein
VGDDEYKVISGRVLFGEKVSILRYGFIGETLFYDVQVIGGKKSAIINSNCVRNMAFIGLAVQPSLASCAYSSIAPVVPLPAATSHVVPPSPPPPSASNARSSGIRLRSGQPLQPAATSHVVPPSPPPPSASNARSSGIRLRSGQPLQPVIIKPRTSGTGPGTRELTVKGTSSSTDIRQRSARSQPLPPVSPTVEPKKRAVPATVSQANTAPRKRPNTSQQLPLGSARMATRKHAAPATVSQANAAPSVVQGKTVPTRSGSRGKRSFTPPLRPVAAKGDNDRSAGSMSENSRARIKVSDRNKVNRAKICPHGKRKTRCPICVKKVKGSTGSLCKHFKQKGWCKACKQLCGVYYGEARKLASKDG